MVCIQMDTKVKERRHMRNKSTYCCENIVKITQKEKKYGYYVSDVKSWYEITFVVMENLNLFWKINFDKIKCLINI